MRGLAAVILLLSVFAVVLGLSLPLMAVVLERQGHPVYLIGLNAGAGALGMIAAAFIVPGLAHRVGADRLALAAALVVGLLFLLMGLWQNIWFWFAARLVLGFAVNTLYVLSETWITTMAPPGARGRVMGLYATVFGIGFAAGPFSLTLVGTEGLMPFLVGVGSAAAAASVLISLQGQLPGLSEGAPASLFRFLPLAPVLLIAVGALAAYDQTTFSLLPIYLLYFGFDARAAALAVTVLIAGNIVLQIPLGWLGDRVGARNALCACALVTALAALVLPVTVGTIALWPLLVVWGAAANGVYTMALADLSARFTGSDLLAGNAAFALMWGVGGLVGTPAAGAAMDVGGPNGLPHAIAAAFLGLGLLVLGRAKTA